MEEKALYSQRDIFELQCFSINNEFGKFLNLLDQITANPLR